MRSIQYLSICSGIEAATVAWHPLGFRPVAFSEIERFPSAVLKYHYPLVPNLGDINKFKEWKFGKPVDLLVGGTPCQSFSVAGLRKGLDDPRGNLALTFIAIAERFRPRWVVWENVPGVLSSSEGRDFGSFLGALAELGYGFAHRVLDAQFFGVAQRRRRVFVVGHLGNQNPAIAVLFERESLSGNPPPRRKTGKEIAPTIGARTMGGGGLGTDAELDGALVAELAPSLSASGPPFSRPGNDRVETEALVVTAPVTSKDASECLSPTLRSSESGTNRTPAVAQAMHVRRLTPRECERLQGFPDDYTRIPWRVKSAEECPDGPRYCAIGNSMAVPVMRWIGERILMVDKIINKGGNYD